MAEAMNVQALAGLGITGEIAQKRALVGRQPLSKTKLAVGQIRSLHRHQFERIGKPWWVACEENRWE